MALNADPALWLTVLGSDATGSCESQSLVSVGFGEDTVVGCAVHVQLAEFDDCGALRAKLLAPLLSTSRPREFFFLSSRFLLFPLLMMMTILS